MNDVSKSVQEVLVARTAARRIAVPALDVIQICERTPATPLPDTGPHVHGLINSADLVAPLIDIALLLGDQGRDADNDPHSGEVVLLSAGGAPCALLVDAVEEQLALTDDEIHAFHRNQDSTESMEADERGVIGHELLRGEFTHNERPVILLDTRALHALVVPEDPGRDRASFLGRGDDGRKDSRIEQEHSYLVFSVAGEDYGLSLDEAGELVESARYSRLPSAPSPVLGLARLREATLLLLDSAALLGLDNRSFVENGLMLVFPVRGQHYAMTVDAVRGILSCPESAHRRVTDSRSPLSSVVVPEDGSLLGILAPERLIDPAMAEKFAPWQPEEHQEEETAESVRETFLHVRVGNESWGVPLGALTGVEQWQKPEPIENGHGEMVRGVVEVFDRITTVLDVEHILNLNQPAACEWLVVMDFDSTRRALPVEQVLELAQVEREQITELRHQATEFASRLAHHDGQMVSLLDTQKLARIEAKA